MELEVSVIFPAYNEGGNILPLLNESREVLPKFFKKWEIIVVDDGSSDNTRSKVEGISRKDKRVRVISHKNNIGYGGALRTGFSNARYNLIFFSDGDGQFDMKEIGNLLPHLDNADIVTGYRFKRADPFYRLINAKLYQYLVRVIFGIRIKDVDCAFKIIKRDVFNKIFLESEGTLISAELLYKVKKNGFKVTEIPVHHYRRQKGTPTGTNLKATIKVFFELLKWRIKWGGIA